MQRWQGAALAVVFIFAGGCLDAQVGDAPGYSRWVLPPGSVPPLATDEVTTFRKIDVNDGVTKPMVSPKSGWAAGAAVRYWDFGAGKRGASPAYALSRCAPDNGLPPITHPVIVDSIPGDSDYSPYRAFQVACVTSKYNYEVIPSLDAFNDAIDLGLITDPTAMPAAFWIDMPIVAPEVALGGVADGTPSTAFYRGTRVLYHSLESQEGQFPVDGMPLVTGNVYEILKPGSMTPVRVIFSQPYWLADGVSRNPLYTPAWIQVTVTLKAPTVMPAGDMAALTAKYDEILATLTKESDLVTVGMNNALTVVNPSIIASAMATTNRVNRPFVVHPEGM